MKAIGDAASWALRLQQLRGIMALELRQLFLGRRGWIVYLLAALPVVLMTLRLVLSEQGRRPPAELAARLGGEGVLFAILFRSFTLRMVIFFACVAVFMNLFRGEFLRRTLHYYLLSPVRRDLLVAGKFLAGVLFCTSLFWISTAVSYVLTFQTAGFGLEAPFRSGGLSHLACYFLIVLLACAGYGAIFLMMGLVFKNPIIPAGFILGLESINFLLPPVLKQVSVIHYLESLAPVPIPFGLIAILSDPAPAWLAIPGLCGLVLILLWAATLRLGRAEVLYGED